MDYFTNLDNVEEQYKCERAAHAPACVPRMHACCCCRPVANCQPPLTRCLKPQARPAPAVAFKIYDTDGDGYISADELHQTLSSLIGRSYPEAHLHQVRAWRGTRAALEPDASQQCSSTPRPQAAAWALS